MTGLSHRHRLRNDGAGYALLLLALILFAVPVAATKTGLGITAYSTVTVDNAIGQEPIVLARLATAPGGAGEPVFTLQWVQDTASWFPAWKLTLVAAPGMLRDDAVPRNAGNGNSDHIVSLAEAAPALGHVYEAVVSYDADLGAMAIKLTDLTEDKVVYAGAIGAAAYDEPLHAAWGTTVPVYVPVAGRWHTGLLEEGQPFLALQQFSRRDEPAYIRLTQPATVPGHYVITLKTDDGEQHIANVKPDSTQSFIPLPLQSVPLGTSVLRFDYVHEDDILITEERPISLGNFDVGISPLMPDPSSQTVGINVNVRSAGTFEDAITMNLNASIYELVWNADIKEFEEVLLDVVSLYDGALDMSQAAAELSLQFAMPDRPGNWKTVVETDVSPQVTLHERGNERLFSSHKAAQVNEGDAYTIAVFPDTQYFARSYPHIFTRMTDWVTANAKEMNIAALLHVGDITDNDTSPQWERAYTSMSLLHGVVPYVLTLGNHDMTNGSGGQVKARGLSLINNYFSASEAARYSHLAGTMQPDRLENHYHLFSIAGTDYVVIALEFGPPDEAIAWAYDVAQQYPDHKMVLLTHSYLARDGTFALGSAGYPIAQDPTTTVNTGADMWDKLIKRSPNSFMVFSGHTSPAVPAVPYRVGRTMYGQPVYEMLFDWQTHDMGGNGWFGLLTFHPDDTVDVRVFSPYLDEWANATAQSGFTSQLHIDLNAGTVQRF